MFHAGPVRVAQKLLAHIPRHFQRGDFQLRRLDSPCRVVEPRQCLQFFPALAHEIAVQDFWKFPRHEHAAPQQIGSAISAAIFQQPGIFRRGHALQERRRYDADGAAQPAAVLERLQHGDGARDFLEARIAAKQFVAAQARQRHLQPGLRGGLADEIAVQPVTRRLVHCVEQAVQVVLEILPRHPDGLMVRAIAPRDLLGQRRFVIGRPLVLLKAEGDGAQLAAGFRGERGEGGAVESR